MREAAIQEGVQERRRGREGEVECLRNGGEWGMKRGGGWWAQRSRGGERGGEPLKGKAEGKEKANEKHVMGGHYLDVWSCWIHTGCNKTGEAITQMNDHNRTYATIHCRRDRCSKKDPNPWFTIFRDLNVFFCYLIPFIYLFLLREPWWSTLQLHFF